MDYRPLGRSGLMVSAVGIGTNAFSGRVDQDGVNEILDAAQDVGVTLLDTADIYGGEPGGSEEMLGHALQGRREEFVVATKFGGDMRGRQRRGPRRPRLPALRPARRRGQPAPAADRPHRPLPAALPRPRHADRGDAGGADRAGARGQGPLHRLLQLRGLAGRRRRLDLRDEGARGVRLGAEPLLAARPHRRGRGGSGLRALRARRSCRSSRWSTACSPASTPAASGRPRLPRRPRPRPRGWLQEADWDRIEALETYAEKRELSHPRRGHRRPRGPAGRRLGDLRGQPRRAGAHQRRRAAVGAHRGRPRRAGRDGCRARGPRRRACDRRPQGRTAQSESRSEVAAATVRGWPTGDLAAARRPPGGRRRRPGGPRSARRSAGP